MSSTREVPQMDWQQVVLNGGPPCFHVEDSRYCGRAERWEGHGHQHGFVSLESLLQHREQEVREEDDEDFLKLVRQLAAMNTNVPSLVAAIEEDIGYGAHRADCDYKREQAIRRDSAQEGEPNA